MIDVIKTNIFPAQIIAGVATGYNRVQSSYFETEYYSNTEILSARSNLKEMFDQSIINSYYFQKQTHSDIVHIVNRSNINDIVESDAIITNEKGIMLNVSIADCQAILLFDPQTMSIGAVHSGWKGTKQNIISKALNQMYENFGSVSSDILVYLSPSASCSNYEVGSEFADYFPNSVRKKDNKYYFDNRREIISQLQDSGIKFKNIESNRECTIENRRLHSYRRDKNESGRMCAFIGISNL